MLRIHVPDIEAYDSETSEFYYVKGQDLSLEHSLISLAKWESKWHKPYLTKDNKTTEEALDYIRCMTLTQNVNPEIYKNLPPKILEEIINYIDDPMTATWFGPARQNQPQRKPTGPMRGREIMTAEVIYYYMIALQIPFECEKWHLNRLLTLIRVCSEKNNPKKMSKREIYDQQRMINAQRRAKLHTKG